MSVNPNHPLSPPHEYQEAADFPGHCLVCDREKSYPAHDNDDGKLTESNRQREVEQ